jgi:hypothetical protein
MPKKKKGAVRHGIRCLICGRDCGKGGGLMNHVIGTHHVDYENGYKRCFKGGDALVDERHVDETGELLVHTRVLKIPPK